MSGNSFQFKQFLIKQDRTAFKVGTDGVLLGAWVDVKRARKVLDIGTGTGLIALMIAQRSDAEIHAVEIDETSFIQAGENISLSTWAERIRLYHGTFQDFVCKTTDKYDLIITNPPYFTDSYKSSDPVRNISRHNMNLSFHELLKSVESILVRSGILALILPVEEGDTFLRLVNSYGIFLKRKTDVLPVEGKRALRYLMEFSRDQKGKIIKDKLVIHDSVNREFTKEYRELTKDFYLHF